MSWKATSYVRQLLRAPNGEPITRSEKLLLMVLADYYNDKQEGAWPSANELAKAAMFSKRRVWELIASVKRKGILEVEHRGFLNGATGSNFYRFPAMESMQGESATARRGEGATARAERLSDRAREGAGAGTEGVLGRSRDGASARSSYNEEPQVEPQIQHTPTSVREGSRHSLRICRDYADYLFRTDRGVKNPGGFATAIHRSGEADELIDEWLRWKSRPSSTSCPDCFGIGLVYPDPDRPDAGVKQCEHPRLAALPEAAATNGRTS